MQVQSYLHFNGCCEEALEFYRRVLGAEVSFLTRFKDSPEPSMAPPGSENKVMHATFHIGGTTLMASDCGPPSFEGFSLAITPPSEEQAQRVFAALSEGGQVRMPLTKTFFSPSFGMLTDRFGVPWMIHVAGAKQ
ncbi:MAG TPA: VOC family protein [Pirellulales bacterium]|nr:VOC family protein [Pirellulales bacterium]